jgi:hypothetical protein
MVMDTPIRVAEWCLLDSRALVSDQRLIYAKAAYFLGSGAWVSCFYAFCIFMSLRKQEHGDNRAQWW